MQNILFFEFIVKLLQNISFFGNIMLNLLKGENIMSKRNDLKILLMCLTLSISTFCININAMEAKPNENLNNYKIKKDFTINNNNNKLNLCNLNIKPIKKCIPEKYSVLKPTKQQTQEYNKNNTKDKKKDIIRPKSEDNLIFKDDKQIYDVKLTRGLILELEDGLQLSFEKNVWFSEDITVTKGYDLIKSFSPVEEFIDGWEEPYSAECNREVITLNAGK